MVRARALPPRARRQNPRAAPEVQHPRVLRLGARSVDRDRDRALERLEPRAIAQVPEVPPGHPDVRLHGDVVVRVPDVVLVLRLKRRQQPNRQLVLDVQRVKRRGVREVGDLPRDPGRRRKRERLPPPPAREVARDPNHRLLEPALTLRVRGVHREPGLERLLRRAGHTHAHQREPLPRVALDEHRRDGHQIARARPFRLGELEAPPRVPQRLLVQAEVEIRRRPVRVADVERRVRQVVVTKLAEHLRERGDGAHIVARAKVRHRLGVELDDGAALERRVGGEHLVAKADERDAAPASRDETPASPRSRASAEASASSAKASSASSAKASSGASFESPASHSASASADSFAGGGGPRARRVGAPCRSSLSDRSDRPRTPTGSRQSPTPLGAAERALRRGRRGGFLVRVRVDGRGRRVGLVLALRGRHGELAVARGARRPGYATGPAVAMRRSRPMDRTRSTRSRVSASTVHARPSSSPPPRRSRGAPAVIARAWDARRVGPAERSRRGPRDRRSSAGEGGNGREPRARATREGAGTGRERARGGRARASLLLASARKTRRATDGGGEGERAAV